MRHSRCINRRNSRNARLGHACPSGVYSIIIIINISIPYIRLTDPPPLCRYPSAVFFGNPQKLGRKPRIARVTSAVILVPSAQISRRDSSPARRIIGHFSRAFLPRRFVVSSSHSGVVYQASISRARDSNRIRFRSHPISSGTSMRRDARRSLSVLDSPRLRGAETMRAFILSRLINKAAHVAAEFPSRNHDNFSSARLPSALFTRAIRARWENA